MNMEIAHAAKTVEDLGMLTRVAVAKSVVSRRTLAQGVVKPVKKPSASASAPIVSNLAANAAATAETIHAHANNTADSVKMSTKS